VRYSDGSRVSARSFRLLRGFRQHVVGRQRVVGVILREAFPAPLHGDGHVLRRNRGVIGTPHHLATPPLRGGDGEQPPFAGHTLELVSAALLELES